jgi:hypothetical protein
VNLQNDSIEDSEPVQKLSFGRVLISVTQACFGVQNASNRERDFKHGRLMPFLVAAVLFVATLVGILLLVVQWVLSGL